jgi:hypothetical protein
MDDICYAAEVTRVCGATPDRLAASPAVVRTMEFEFSKTVTTSTWTPIIWSLVFKLTSR